MKKIFLTPEEAINLLPEGEQIHTFLNSPFALIGADWEREEIIQKVTKSDYREVAGSGARGLKHGLAVYNEGETLQDVMFIETDMERLDALYPAEPPKEET